MATLSPDCIFQKYVLTKEEQLQGSMLQYLQIACIKNQMAALAEERINLGITEQDKNRTIEIIGAIGALGYLLQLHEAAVEEVNSATPASN